MAEQTPTPPAETPAHLLPVREAADLVGRSLSTVRAWVRAGRLEGHREDAANPRSRLLVHRAALLAVAADLDPDGSHGAEGEAPTPTAAPALTLEAPAPGAAELAALGAEVRGLREALTEARRRGDDLAELLKRNDGRDSEALTEARRRAETAETVARDLRSDLEAARAELVGVRAELAALRAAAGLPWWRRLLGSPTAAIPGPPAEG